LLETYAIDDPALASDRPRHSRCGLPREEPSTSLAPGVLAMFDGIRDGRATGNERPEPGFVVCDAL
jgi:hypothetical protein